MAFTEKTLAVSRLLGSGWRWHLKEKLRLDTCQEGGGMGVFGNKKCLPGVLFLDVLDGASAFNGANGETSGIGKAADNSCLPLERTGNGLVDGGWVGQVHHVDVALCCRNDKQLVLDVHAIDALLTLQGSDGLGALQVPELDRLVPRARRNIVFTASLEPAYALDGILVGFGLLGGHSAAGWGCAKVDNVEHAC